MISIIVQSKNIRTGIRKEITDITFPIYNSLRNVEVIISDYGSNDGTEEFVKQFKNLKYLYTEPKNNEFLNMSRCLNNAIVNVAKHNIISPSGTDFIYPNNFSKVVVSMYNNFKKNNEGYKYMMVRPREFDFSHKSYELIERPRSFNYTFTKDMYYAVRGFDERIHDWGGEDEDIRNRFDLILGKENLKTAYPDELVLLHIIHDKSYENSCRREIHKKNLHTIKENVHSKGQNIKNSYYKRELF